MIVNLYMTHLRMCVEPWVYITHLRMCVEPWVYVTHLRMCVEPWVGAVSKWIVCCIAKLSVFTASVREDS